MKDIRDIIRAAGGHKVLGDRLNLRSGTKQWPRIGIPDRYWTDIMEMVPGLTAAELLEANRKAREHV